MRTFDSLRADRAALDDKENQRLKNAYRRLFQTDDGQLVLAHLRHVYSASGPDLSDSALRHLEGQRFLVHRIELLSGQK